MHIEYILDSNIITLTDTVGIFFYNSSKNSHPRTHNNTKTVTEYQISIVSPEPKKKQVGKTQICIISVHSTG